MLAGQHTSFGRGGFVARSLAALGRDRTQHHRVVASASSPLVARLIRDDLQQPWPKRRTSAKSTQSIERLDECLLRRVLRQRRIAEMSPIGERCVALAAPVSPAAYQQACN